MTNRYLSPARQRVSVSVLTYILLVLGMAVDQSLT